MKLESLPEEIYNKVKYLTLEHPCAKLIKDAFTDFKTYLDILFNLNFRSFHPLPPMAMKYSQLGFMVFNEWRKRCARKGVDLLNVEKKRSKYWGARGAVKSLMHYNDLQLIRAARRDGYFLPGAEPSR